MAFGSIEKNFAHMPVRGGFRGVGSPRHGSGNDVMQRSHQWLLACSLLACSLPASQRAIAQEVYRQDERLASDRPEAWAMNYFVKQNPTVGLSDAPYAGVATAK
jgi:hypothetical protein